MNFFSKFLLSSLLSLPMLYYLKHRSGPKAVLEEIYIMPDSLLIDILYQIRKKFSKTYRRSQNNFRKIRRKLEKRSSEYWEAIQKYQNVLPDLLRETLECVLADNQISLKVFDDTMRLRKIDSNVSQTCEEIREIINKGAVSPELTPEVLKDILIFIREKLDQEYNTFSQLPIFQIVTLIEDEVFEMSHFEIEEIERAYELYLDAFKEFDVIFQTICQSKLIPSIEECYSQKQ